MQRQWDRDGPNLGSGTRAGPIDFGHDGFANGPLGVARGSLPVRASLATKVSMSLRFSATTIIAVNTKAAVWLGNQAEAARVAARCVETTVDATTQMRDHRR